MEEVLLMGKINRELYNEEKMKEVLKGVIYQEVGIFSTGMSYSDARVLATYLNDRHTTSALEGSFQELFFLTTLFANKIGREIYGYSKNLSNELYMDEALNLLSKTKIQKATRIKETLMDNEVELMCIEDLMPVLAELLQNIYGVEDAESAIRKHYGVPKQDYREITEGPLKGF